MDKTNHNKKLSKMSLKSVGIAQRSGYATIWHPTGFSRDGSGADSEGDWRKPHIGVDAEGFMVAAELPASSRDDASTLPDLLAPLEVPIRRFTADGAYDHRSVHDRASAAGTENVVIVIPPRRSALSSGPTDGPWAQREASLQRIRKVGRREWRKESGYRQQARVENSFFRYKSVFGGDLKARHSKAQRGEAAIGCHILNRMDELGRPSSYALGR